MSNTTKAEERSLAMIEVTSGMQLRITSISKDGHPVDVGVSVSRINAQHLAYALLEYAGVHAKSADRRHKTSVLAYYDPDFTESCVVHLSATDIRRGRKGK